jgi:hypothetical protein
MEDSDYNSDYRGEVRAPEVFSRSHDMIVTQFLPKHELLSQEEM